MAYDFSFFYNLNMFLKSHMKIKYVKYNFLLCTIQLQIVHKYCLNFVKQYILISLILYNILKSLILKSFNGLFVKW